VGAGSTWFFWTFLRAILDDLPPRAVPQSALLALRIESVESRPQAYLSFLVVEPWVELGITWNTRPALAEEPLPLAMFPPRGWAYADVLPFLTQWLDSVNNFGVCLQIAEERAAQLSLASREYENPEYWPRLIVRYTLEPGPTPTATATPTPGPTNTPLPPTATPTVLPTITLRASIEASSYYYRAGDRLLVWGVIENQGMAVDFVEVAVLEYSGYFAFWPSWTPYPQGRSAHLEPREKLEVTFLDFVWPSLPYSLSEIRIWHAAMSPEFLEPYSNLDYCVFWHEGR
jgi:hypothetical protein